MDDRISRILELEKRLREERNELDNLAEIADISDDYFVQNKLKYLQAEIDYLNSQCSLLSQMSGAKSKSVKISEPVKVEQTVIEETQVEEPVVLEEAAAAEPVVETVVKEPAAAETVAEDIKPVEEPRIRTWVRPKEEYLPVNSELEEAASIENILEESLSADTVMEVAEPEQSTPVVLEEASEPEQTVSVEEIAATIEEPPVEEYEVEQTIEIKSIPEAVKNEGTKKKKSSIENRIGLLVMPILAATLIFVSVILLASALPETFGNIIKQITMFVAGFTFVGTGLLLHKKKKGGAFGQVLMAIGVGELFVSLVVCRFVFKSLNDLGLFIAIFIWSALLIILKRYSNIMFQVIGEIGVSIAVNFGVCYSLSTGNHAGLFVIFAFYALTGIIYYFLFKFRGSLANVIIFHAFNIINIIFLSTGALLGFQNGLMVCGVLGLFCASCEFLAAVDIIVTFRHDATVDQIFGSIVNFVYAIHVFATSFFAVSYLILAHFGFTGEMLVDKFSEIPAIVGETRWIAIAVPCLLIGFIILLIEFVWTEKIPQYCSEGLLLFIVFGALLCSHTTFKFGFFIAMFTLTIIGYMKKNHLLKIAGLLFYVVYALLPNEDVLRIVVGIGMAVLVLAFLYTLKEQYLLAYKICIYFSLILYAIMVSFSAFDTSSTIGIEYVVIAAFISLLNLLVMFTPLSKNKEKILDIAVIPEVLNIALIPATLILASVIVAEGGTIGYIPLLLAFVMLIVSIFRGYLQKRFLCRIAAIVTLAVGVFALYEFNYSAFWFAGLAIGLAIALMYIKKESYSFIDKFCYFFLSLMFFATCILYFADKLSVVVAVHKFWIFSYTQYSYYKMFDIWLIASVLFTFIFMFTGLAKTSDMTRNDFEWVTFITGDVLALASMVNILIPGKVKTLYVSIAVIFVITLVWLIYGFVAEKTKEKIAVLGALYLMFALCTTVKLEFIIFEILIAALFLLLLYIKKDAYRGIYKYLVYINLLINSVVIPYLSCQGFCYFIYFRAAETTIISTVLLTLLFKYTILSKNPANKENDFFIMTFITDVLAVLFASYQLYDIGIEYNYLFVAVLTVIGIEWILHGFLSKKNTEKIAFLAEMILLASLSWLINPVVYLIIAITLTALFTLMLYLKSEGYSVIYKIAIYIIALINCIVIPVGFIETLEQVEWLGVAGTALIAMFAVTMLYKFTTLSKNPQTEESDFIWATFITEVSLCVYAIILMPIFKEAGNWIPATILALIACVWLIHGFTTESLIEKIAVLVEAYVFAFICTSFNPTMYVVITVIIIAVFLFLLYTQENAYSFVFKLCIYVLSMINAFIWPLLFRETLNSLPILVPLNLIFLLLFAVNTLFRFSPLVCNPETDERDMRIITIIVSHVLAVLGIGFTFALKAPEDVFTCAITLILIPIATSWVWTDEDDEPTLLRYIAVGEYVFIPFMLCYALSAPNYVSSIVGIVLAVGCIVLGFAMKMKGVRIYGLVISMIMIFKLALVDFEKSSLLAYALSFFIAGISCLIISMLYYFVNAAVEKNE